MASDLEIDRQVVHQAVHELELTLTHLEDCRSQVRQLEEASFGDSDLGLRTQAQAEAADAAVRETVHQLRAVHDDLVEALRTMQAQADAADADALAQVAALTRATSTVGAGTSSSAGAAPVPGAPS